MLGLDCPNNILTQLFTESSLVSLRALACIDAPSLKRSLGKCYVELQDLALAWLEVAVKVFNAREQEAVEGLSPLCLNRYFGYSPFLWSWSSVALMGSLVLVFAHQSEHYNPDKGSESSSRSTASCSCGDLQRCRWIVEVGFHVQNAESSSMPVLRMSGG